MNLVLLVGIARRGLLGHPGYSLGGPSNLQPFLKKRIKGLNLRIRKTEYIKSIRYLEHIKHVIRIVLYGGT